jgi:hypothetical protein
MLNNRQELPESHAGHSLDDARGPLNPHQVDIGCVSQTEGGFQRTGTEITTVGKY